MDVATYSFIDISCTPQPQHADQIVLATFIWANAAHIYIMTVLSGWQPTASEIRESVAKTLELFAEVKSSRWRRSLMWPFCVTACLATVDREEHIRDILSSTRSLGVFGSVRDASNVVERVWKDRHMINADDWNFASCFKNLDFIACLV